MNALRSHISSLSEENKKLSHEVVARHKQFFFKQIPTGFPLIITKIYYLMCHEDDK